MLRIVTDACTLVADGQALLYWFYGTPHPYQVELDDELVMPHPGEPFVIGSNVSMYMFGIVQTVETL